jgi:hypothetical protein
LLYLLQIITEDFLRLVKYMMRTMCCLLLKQYTIKFIVTSDNPGNLRETNLHLFEERMLFISNMQYNMT